MEIKYYKPTISDIPAMQELVADEVKKGIILKRNEDEMASNIRSYILVSINNKLAGFVATHIHSMVFAEVRSLIVKKEHRGLKLGRTLVEKCIEEAKYYNVEKLLTLTYREEFFKKLNFIKINKEEIPETKIWADCIKCKNFPNCNEVALIYKIK